MFIPFIGDSNKGTKLPGDSVDVNLKVPSLQGAIKIMNVDVTASGYNLTAFSLNEKEVKGGLLGLGDTVYYQDNLPPIYEATATFRIKLPSDKKLYGKSLSIHYNALVSRPIVMEDQKHYAWESTNFEDNIVVNMGTREQAWKTDFLVCLTIALAGALTFGVIFWKKEELLKPKI